MIYNAWFQVHSLVHSLIHSLVHSLVYCMVHDLVHSLVISLAHSLVHSLVNGLVHILVWSLVWCIVWSLVWCLVLSSPQKPGPGELGSRLTVGQVTPPSPLLLETSLDNLWISGEFQASLAGLETFKQWPQAA